MIYTIGHRDSYEQYFDERKKTGRSPKKVGKTKNYPGGSVWKTFEEALKNV